MTKYEYLMNKANECEKKSKETNDVRLTIFYLNASEGFRIKAGKLTAAEAGERVK